MGLQFEDEFDLRRLMTGKSAVSRHRLPDRYMPLKYSEDPSTSRRSSPPTCVIDQSPPRHAFDQLGWRCPTSCRSVRYAEGCEHGRKPAVGTDRRPPRGGRVPGEPRDLDDPAVRLLEMARIFEGGVGVPRHRRPGRRHRTISSRPRSVGPVLVSCDASTLGAFVNSCMHKGSRLAQTQSATPAQQSALPGWTYDSAGRNKGSSCTRPAATPRRLRAGDMIRPASAFEEYRGFLFAASAPTCRRRSPNI